MKNVLIRAMRYIDNLIPDQEIAGIRMPLFYEGDLIENVHPHRPHVLLDMNCRKALIVGVAFKGDNWFYDVLLDGELHKHVSANIVEAEWSLNGDNPINDVIEQSN